MNGISFGNVSTRNLCIKGDKMFEKNKKENKKVTIVTTKEQLKAAVNRKDSCIEVRGDLAKKMNWIAKLSKKKAALIIAALTGAAMAIPVTGGVSLAAAGAMSTEVVALVTALGVAVVVAILNGYSVKADVLNGILILTKSK